MSPQTIKRRMFLAIAVAFFIAASGLAFEMGFPFLGAALAVIAFALFAVAPWLTEAE